MNKMYLILSALIFLILLVIGKLINNIELVTKTLLFIILGILIIFNIICIIKDKNYLKIISILIYLIIIFLLYKYNVKTTINLVLLYLMSMYFSVIICSYITNKNIQIKDYDSIIILGNKMHNDNPSNDLTSRLETSIDYIKNNNVSNIIVSGGLSKTNTISEAEYMKKYLIENGIDENKILVEDKSKTTYQNFKYSLDNTLGSIAIITSDYHGYRAKCLTSKFNKKANIITSKTKWYKYPSLFIVEVWGLIYVDIIPNVILFALVILLSKTKMFK